MPVKPSESAALIPAANTPICDKVVRGWIQLPILIDRLVRDIWNEDGSVTTAFRASIGLTVGGLGIPANVTASDGTYSNYVAITWSSVSGAQSYEVWRSTSNSTTSATMTKVGSPTELTYNDGTAVVSQVYFYFIRAVNAGGVSLFSAGDPGNSGYAVAAITNAIHFDGTRDWPVPVGVNTVKVVTYGSGGTAGGGSYDLTWAGGSLVAYGGGGGGAGGKTTVSLVSVSLGNVIRVTIGESPAPTGGISRPGSGGQPTMVSNFTTGQSLGVANGGGGGGSGAAGVGGSAGVGGAGTTTTGAVGFVGLVSIGGAGGPGTDGYGGGGQGGNVGAGGGKGTIGHAIIYPNQ